jgi:ATP-dependent DNA helicase RecQ
VKVLIVAKTRRGNGACVGGITDAGRSVRLVAANAASHERAGLEYNLGDVWELTAAPDPNIIPPHVENVIVWQARRVRQSDKLEETIRRFMPPVEGGPGLLFDGFTQTTPAGGLFVCERTGLPSRSTMFWVPDQALTLDTEGKRIRYRYPAAGRGCTLTYVGFQDPLPEIPPGTLLRVSLAHPWRPKDQPEEELRCFVQLSGWVLGSPAPGRGPIPSTASPALGCAPIQNKPPSGREDSLVAARQILKATFGFSEFLPMQAEVIGRVLRRLDTLVVMPTGGGKSLCYQLPALVGDGLTVVISPLIALMQDQVRQLRELAISAACLNHMVPLPEWTAITHRVRTGAIRILYLAPETVFRPEMLLLIESSRLACLAVDEAHCISEWGHDFRPEYRQLRDLRRRFAPCVCLALTATATTRVREDIRRLLEIPAEGEFVASFNRPNLHLTVEGRRDALAQIIAFLEKRRGQSGIIYCGTRKQVDELCAALNANRWVALPYHAGLEDEVRRQNQERFIQDEVPLIVATIAFGMGINKSNVRFVIHAHLPKDLEGYYQEIGRAGRDGLPADCLLLYSRGDAMVHRHFINQGAASERAGRQARLEALMRFAETRTCRRVPLLAYFGETFAPPCGHCDNCTHKPEPGQSTDVTAAARKFLSCVQMTGELFGPAHLIAILRGSKSEKVLARHHDRVALYGAGQEHSTEQWRELVRQFLELGIVEQDFEFGSVKLTLKARAVLDENETVLIAAAPIPAPSALPGSGTHDAQLFLRLRALRRELANAAQVPPYLVFSDRALLEMATRLPRNEGEFLAINGVGQIKLEKYGGDFLRLIREYGDLRRGSPVEEAGPCPIVRPASRRRFQEVGDEYASGQNIDQIARRYNVTRQTILQHLEKFIESGGCLDPVRLLAESKLNEQDRAAVWQAFELRGSERLGPVHDALGGKVSYEELHLLRVHRLGQRQRRF